MLYDDDIVDNDDDIVDNDYIYDDIYDDDNDDIIWHDVYDVEYYSCFLIIYHNFFI